MTDNERKTLAREQAKSIVAALRASNEQAAKKGAPKVDEASYRSLQGVVTRKLLRS